MPTISKRSVAPTTASSGFGGTMDCKHLIGIDGTDDGYDWQWARATALNS
jgi:hypothetical protein